MMSVASTCFLHVSAQRAGVGTFMEQIPNFLTASAFLRPNRGRDALGPGVSLVASLNRGSWPRSLALRASL